MILEIITAAILIILIPVLVYKTYIKKDLSVLASIVPRVYLLLAVIYYIVVPEAVEVDVIHVGVALVFATDIYVNLIYLFSRRYLNEISNANLIRKYKILQDNYAFLVETSPIGKYVVNDRWEIEFANQALADILEYKREELIGKNILDFVFGVNKEIVKSNVEAKLKGSVDHTDYLFDVKTQTGKIVKVRVVGKITENGHKAILGSVMRV